MSFMLLMRPDDHVVLGVRWSGLQVHVRSGGNGPVLVADDGDGRLTLTFPPQHLAEEFLSVEASAAEVRETRQSQLSGPTVLEFPVTRGTEIELTVEGLLAATSGLAVADYSRIELPWGLPWQPHPDGGVIARHRAVHGAPGSTSALWRTHLEPPHAAGSTSSARPRPAPFELVVDGDAALVDDPFPAIPLERGSRHDIVRSMAEAPARVNRLELSALGGTLSAIGRWQSFEWDHDAVLGRDMWVRTLARGFLYPFGHRAEYEERVVRLIDPVENVAVLRAATQLTVTEPVREPSEDPRTMRGFPFDDVEITQTVFTDLDVLPDWQEFALPNGQSTDAYLWPMTSGGTKVLFPVTCATANGPVRFSLPLLFVKDLAPAVDSASDPALAVALRTYYDSVRVTIPATRIDLVRARDTDPADGDTHEVRAFTISGSEDTIDPRPCLDELEIALPALRTLLDDSSYRTVAFTEDFRERGESATAFLEVARGHAPIDINFVGRSDASGGLAALNYAANAISRTDGPVHARLGPMTELELSPSSLFKDDASVLGFPLRQIVDSINKPPAVTSWLTPGHSPVVTMTWSDFSFKHDLPGFKAGAGTRLTLDVVVSAAEATTTCSIYDFRLQFPTAEPLVELSFEELTFVRRSGSAARGRGQDTEFTIQGFRATLLGKLKLLEELGKVVSLGEAGPQVTASPSGVAVTYSLPLPAASAGVFVMRNILLRTRVDVPFTGEPPEVMLGFASRENPFVLTVMAFGGGGYIELIASHRGLRRVDVALEFGALVAVEFFIARGEAHVLGGVRLVLEAEYAGVVLTGYIRIGGTLDVLGLVSVSVELRIGLTYQSDSNALVGRATLIIEIDILFWSESVELDSGEWRLVGGRAPSRETVEYAKTLPRDRDGVAAIVASAVDSFDEGLENWSRYRSRFAAPRPVGADR